MGVISQDMLQAVMIAESQSSKQTAIPMKAVDLVQDAAVIFKNELDEYQFSSVLSLVTEAMAEIFRQQQFAAQFEIGLQFSHPALFAKWHILAFQTERISKQMRRLTEGSVSQLVSLSVSQSKMLFSFSFALNGGQAVYLKGEQQTNGQLL